MSHRCYGPATVRKNSILIAELRPARRGVRDAALAVGGGVFAVAALATIWSARATIPRDLYVSELGAVGMPTRYWFMAALLCLVVAGALVGWAARRVRSEVAVLRWWPPAVSLWIAAALFLFASQVTCTRGCPVPYGPTFDWQDLSHIVAAVLAFAFACWAMLQSAFARRHRAIAVLSQVCCWSVAVIAGTGGILSLARVGVDFGSWCEFVATTIAIGWVVLLAIALAREWLRPSGPSPSRQRDAVAAPPASRPQYRASR